MRSRWFLRTAKEEIMMMMIMMMMMIKEVIYNAITHHSMSTTEPFPKQ